MFRAKNVTACVAQWTPEMVKLRLEQAAETERRRPVHNLRPDHARSSWPAHQIQHSADVIDFFPPQPSAEEIDRAEEAMNWLLWLESVDLRKLLWRKAQNVQEKILQFEFGKSRTTLHRDCKTGWSAISTTLNCLNIRK